MKQKVILTALAFGLGLVVNAAQATDTDTDSSATSPQSANKATRAITNGPGQAATPAMPGNETAEDKVSANRKKEMDNRKHAASLSTAAKAKGASGNINHVSHPTVERPHIERPNIERPEINRPEINR